MATNAGRARSQSVKRTGALRKLGKDFGWHLATRLVKGEVA